MKEQKRMWQIFLLLPAMLYSIGWSKTADVRIGIYTPSTAEVSPQEIRIGVDMWMRHLAESVQLDTTTHYYKKAVKLAEDFKKGKINMLVADPLTYVQYFDLRTLRPGVIGYIESRKKDGTLLFLVRREDRKRPFGYFLSRTISIPKNDRLTPIYLKTVAWKKSLKKLRLDRTKNSQMAILHLFFKRSDMAAVSLSEYETAAELNPQIKSELKPLRTLFMHTGALVFIGTNMPEDIYNKIIKAAFDLPKTPKGRELMMILHAKEIDQCDIDQLVPAKNYYKLYKTLRRKGHS